VKIAIAMGCGAAALVVASAFATTGAAPGAGRGTSAKAAAKAPPSAERAVDAVSGESDLAAKARRLEHEAQGGSAHAAFLLGNAYRAGAGVPRDDAKALALYERAAQAEHPAALQTLALVYRYGELGLAPDEAEARRYQMEADHAAREAPAPR
jgi:TPR repeat protein